MLHDSIPSGSPNPSSQQGHSCCNASTAAPGAAFRVVLINPYELGRQPFALAEASAWLKRAGVEVQCLDLSLQKLEPEVLAGANAVALYVGMHTATRIAMEALPRVRELAPGAAIAVFGLYAPMNDRLLRDLGATAIFGGESEPDLLAWVDSLRGGVNTVQSAPVVNRSKIEFLKPDRSGLPALERYAHVILGDGSKKTVGFIEASRGCKHLCRHCPVVPVYEGKFRIVPLEVVMEDIAQQVAAGAAHISFSDHDFLNGPTHAIKVVRAMHERWPHLSFDATIKIEHLIQHTDLLPELKACGCAFIISAIESVDDQVLGYLAKNHTRADFYQAVKLLRAHDLALAPTWVAFHPWTTLEGYLDLLRSLVELELVEAVPPVQLSIRLLIPQGSLLLELPGFRDLIGAFDSKLLGYPWKNPDARVDALQREVQDIAARGEKDELPRRAIFRAIWEAAHRAAGLPAPSLEGRRLGQPVPHLSEPWYCCAEPTEQQLQSF
jgi:radical SAM superfamily enzyme YgiQ (UPF0313 family)